MLRSEKAVTTQTTIDAFEAGNYTRVLLEGSPECWQWHAAAGLVGRTDEAISGLGRFNNPEARFYQGVASWIGGDEVEAKKILARVNSEHARRLLALISKPVISVLTMLPPGAGGPHVVYAGASRDLKFNLTNIGDNLREGRRWSSDAYEDILGKINPDFFICQMIEWHQIPTTLRLFPCPTIGHTSDYDLHIQALFQWLNAFDEILVSDHDEHDGVKPLTKSNVSVFPKAFGCTQSLPPLLEGERDIDLFLSGTIFHPWHPDKARLFQELLATPGLRMVGFNGYLAEREYYKILSRSRLCVAYYRRYGGVVTRGIEGAAMGCATLVPRGSALNVYMDSDCRLIEYDPAAKATAANSLSNVSKQVLAHYESHHKTARKSAMQIRNAFAPTLVGSQYLRFCTYLAARPRQARTYNPSKALDQRHLVILKGWLPGRGDPRQVRSHAATNLGRWRSVLKGAPSSARRSTLNNALRERLLMHVFRLARAHPTHWHDRPLSVERSDFPFPGIRDALIADFRRASAAYPNRLVLLFNYLRFAIHLGNDDQFADALKALDQALARQRSFWDVDPEDDVLPYDVFFSCFNYRAYLDSVVSILAASKPKAGDLVGFIVASLHHYRARVRDNIDDARAAAELDPDFPFYVLDYAKRLSFSTSPDDRRKAAELLDPLVNTSMLSQEAWAHLSRLQAGEKPNSVPALPEQIERFQDTIIASEQYLWRRPNMLSLAQIPGPGGSLGHTVIRNPRFFSSRKQFSIAFVDQGAAHWKSFVDFLADQTAPRTDYEAILAEVYDHVPRDVAQLFDTIVLSRQDEILPSMACSANHAAIVARSGILVMVEGAPKLNSSALNALVAAVDQGAARAAVASSPGGAALAVNRDTLLAFWGGFDEHPIFNRAGTLIGSLCDRLRAAGTAIATVQGDIPTVHLTSIRRALLDNNFEVRRQRSLEPLFPSGSVEHCVARFDILDRMQSHPFVRRTDRGLSVPDDAPRGHALFGPYLALEVGEYRLHWDAKVDESIANNTELVSLEISIGPYLQTRIDLTAGALKSPTPLPFAISARERGEPCEFRFSNLQNGGWTITNLVVSRRLNALAKTPGLRMVGDMIKISDGTYLVS